MMIRSYSKAPMPTIQGGEKLYVDRELTKLKNTTDDIITDVGTLAPLASPALTGNPTAPTPASGDNSTSIATTAFVKKQNYIVEPASGATLTLPGPLSAAGVIHSTSGGFEFPDGTTQTTAATTVASTTDFISGFLPYPQNQTYTLLINSPVALTITQTTTGCDSGTCTATFYANGTALDGTANAVSSTQTSQTHSTAVSSGGYVQMVISANSSCQNMRFTLQYTRPV